MQRFYVVREVLNEKLKRGYEFTIKNEYIENKVTERLKEVAAHARIDGFRKGKVSPEFVRKTYGAGVADEVVSQVVDEASSAFLKENNLENIVDSDLKIISPSKAASESGKGGDLVYELKFEVMPEVPAVDVESITLKEIEVKVSSEDVESFLEDLKANYPSFVVAEDAAKCVEEGDHITVNYKSTFKGKALKGGSVTGFSFILGKDKLLPGFEGQVAGMKKGEVKEFKLLFPDDYAAPHFAGKEVDMRIELVEIKVKDDIKDRKALAKKCGFKTVKDLVKFATDGLQERFTKMSETLVRKELFDYLDENYNLDVPEFIVSREVSGMMRGAAEGKDAESPEDVTKEAVRRVKLGMLLMKVANDAGVTIEPDDVLSFIGSNYQNYGRSFDAALKLFRSSRDFRDHVRGKVLEDKVVRYIIAKTKKDKQSMSAKELKSLFGKM